MSSVKVKECCAICTNLENKDKCPLQPLIAVARDYGHSDDINGIKFKVRCDNFVINDELKSDEIEISDIKINPMPIIQPYFNPCANCHYYTCTNCPYGLKFPTFTFATTSDGTTTKEEK